MRNLFRRSVILLTVLAVSTPAFAWDEAKPAKDDDYYELMKLFVDSFEQIERNYVKDVDRRELIEAALRGMTTQLDPYSSYFSRDDLTKFNQQVEQEFGGIGIQVHVDERTRELIVMTPLPGTPAYRAGVLAGDVIIEIEGKAARDFPTGQEMETAIRMLKGNPGDPVSIRVRREGVEQPDEIKLVREIIQVSTVLGDTYTDDGTWNYMVDPEQGIGYIRLTHFSRKSTEEMKAALDTLKKQNMRALILDLRFNPGGLLTQATEIADLFVESGRIVSTSGRNSRERVWTASKDGTYTGFPMVVLVNRYSASASEIVSACLQDHGRAIVIGERTWGKGSVQNVIELEQGSSALKLTTASYLRPSGKNIHRFQNSDDDDEWGVMPDDGYSERLSSRQWQDYLEYRQKRDVLSKEGPPKSEFKDRHLAKAVGYLQAKLNDSAPSDKDSKDSAKDSDAKPAGDAEDAAKKDAQKKDGAKEDRKPDGAQSDDSDSGEAAVPQLPVRSAAA